MTSLAIATFGLLGNAGGTGVGSYVQIGELVPDNQARVLSPAKSCGIVIEKDQRVLSRAGRGRKVIRHDD